VVCLRAVKDIACSCGARFPILCHFLRAAGNSRWQWPELDKRHFWLLAFVASSSCHIRLSLIRHITASVKLIRRATPLPWKVPCLSVLQVFLCSRAVMRLTKPSFQFSPIYPVLSLPGDIIQSASRHLTGRVPRAEPSEQPQAERQSENETALGSVPYWEPDAFNMAPLLGLPQTFGCVTDEWWLCVLVLICRDILMGETFSCYISIHNHSEDKLKDVSIKVLVSLVWFPWFFYSYFWFMCAYLRMSCFYYWPFVIMFQLILCSLLGRDSNFACTEDSDSRYWGEPYSRFCTEWSEWLHCQIWRGRSTYVWFYSYFFIYY
jgi:hypothetical protein